MQDTQLAISDDVMIRIWDLASWASVGDPLHGHEAAVLAIAALPGFDG